MSVINKRLYVQEPGANKFGGFPRYIMVEGDDILTGRFMDVVCMGQTPDEIEAFAHEVVARWNATPVLLASLKAHLTPGMFDAVVHALGLSAVPEVSHV